MAIGQKHVISLSFWRKLQHVKDELLAREVVLTEFDSDPIGVLRREDLDVPIEVDDGTEAIALTTVLENASESQRDTILQYLRPYSRGSGLYPAGDRELSVASGASSANVSSTVNAVAIANAGVNANATANANIVVNVNIVSNVNLVVAVPLLTPNEISGGE